MGKMLPVILHVVKLNSHAAFCNALSDWSIIINGISALWVKLNSHSACCNALSDCLIIINGISALWVKLNSHASFCKT